MWETKLLISPVKKEFFAQKRPNLALNWHFWSIWARPCRFFWCPVGWSVGGCGARAVSRKTPIYFIIIIIFIIIINDRLGLLLMKWYLVLGMKMVFGI